MNDFYELITNICKSNKKARNSITRGLNSTIINYYYYYYNYYNTTTTTNYYCYYYYYYCCERNEQRHISDGFPVPAIPEICLGGMYVRTYDLIFEPRIHARSSHVHIVAQNSRKVILHRKRDSKPTSLYGVYARSTILNMEIDLLSVWFEIIIVMTAFKLELEEKLECGRTF